MAVKNTKGNERIVAESVWLKKSVQSREHFLREALIRLAETGLAPELFFSDFKLTEFNDEFLAVSADVDLEYSFELGTPVRVKEADYAKSLKPGQIVIVWENVEYKAHKVVHAVINKNWDGQTVESKSYQNDRQQLNGLMLENHLTDQFAKAEEIALKEGNFPNKGMTGKYDESTTSFSVTPKAQNRIIEKCCLMVCSEYLVAKHKRNLQYDGSYNILSVYGIVIPRYKLTYSYKGTKYSVVDGVWGKDADIEQTPPTTFRVEKDSERKLRKKMIEQMEGPEDSGKQKNSEANVSFWGKLRNKLSAAFSSKQDKNKVKVSIKVATADGVKQEVVTYDKEIDKDHVFEAKDKKNSQRIIALAMALERYNLSPMTEDDYENLYDIPYDDYLFDDDDED